MSEIEGEKLSGSSSDLMPGLALKNLLKKIIPQLTPQKDMDSDFVFKLDELLGANGDFRALVYDSCINYALRRLITMGKYVRRECIALKQDEAYYLKMLRRQISMTVNIPDVALRERLGVLVNECVQKSGAKISSTKVNHVRESAINGGKACYICGRELNRGVAQDTPQVDHIWPHALGGDNRDDNLAVSCERCNQIKQDHIGHSDYHYERVASWVLGYHDVSFLKAFDTARRMAVWAKGNWRCAVCGKAAEDCGPLILERINNDEHWHFLNMQCVCKVHAHNEGEKNG